MKRSPRTYVGLAATIAFFAIGWWLLGPSQLGGPTSYAVLSGISMEPHLERGDLVLTRAKPSYTVGEVVLYEDHETGSRVLHRIIGERNGHFVTKGDNNDFIDPVHPAPDEVVGKFWFAVPGAGSVLAWLKEPVNLAILLTLLVLASLGGGREVSRRRGPASAARPVVALPDETPVSPALAPTVARASATAGAIAFVLFVVLGVAAWSASESSSRSVPDLYAHQGAFSYSAETGPGPVYPTGEVERGMPVFTRLVDKLAVSFSYQLEAQQAADVHGTIALDAVVHDPTGWERTLPIAAPATFEGTSATARGTFDVSAFEILVQEAREQTAAPLAGISVELRPRVDVAGTVGATDVEDAFAPRLTFSYDNTTLKPLPPAGAPTDAVPPFESRRVEAGSELVPATVGIGSLALSVGDARTMAGLGLVTSLLVLVAAGALLAARSEREPGDRIAIRHASRVVHARAVVPEERWVTEVDDIDDLSRIADAYDRVILHVTENGDDVYLVDDGIAVYRYRVQRAARPAGPLPSASW
jgi:signal peptidase I